MPKQLSDGCFGTNWQRRFRILRLIKPIINTLAILNKKNGEIIDGKLDGFAVDIINGLHII